ncbi:MAG TPA: hypothetical protein VG328_03735 [Stellaceae bacterium]|jgi:hypothetical protein|nr:hypothetical protein [Stellaceae bacterium]
MLAHSVGQVSRFNELSPGTIFAFSIGAKRYVGIKTVYETPNPPVISFATIWWERASTGERSWQHPMQNGKAVDLTATAIWENPVFAFPEAQLVPSSDASMIYTGTAVTSAGCLIMANEKIVLVGASEVPDRVYCVEADTGKILTDLFSVSRPKSTVTIWDWSIVQLVRGEMVTICRGPLG